MAKEPLTITLGPTSELARFLAASDAAEVFVDSNGKRYRVSPVTEDIAAGDEPDSARVRSVLAQTVGSWADLDIDRVLAEVAAAR
jgi:hypothetical protein